MQYTIKDLQTQWLSKNLIYEALKLDLPFSKQFQKNRRFFNEKDLEMFLFFKQFGYEKTIVMYWNSQQLEKNSNSLETDFKNSSETISTDSKKELENELKTVINKEQELKKIIAQKEQIIQVKEEQTQKYALLKQEEKKEKDEWIKKYDEVQKEKNEWVGKFYSVKMYMIIFLILFIVVVAFEVVQFFVK